MTTALWPICGGRSRILTLHFKRKPNARAAFGVTFADLGRERAGSQSSAVLLEDPLQIHFQRRVCDLEDFTFELAKTVGFGDGVGELEVGVKKPDFGNAFSNIIVAASSNFSERLVA